MSGAHYLDNATDFLSMEYELEMATWDQNGHVLDDVALSMKRQKRNLSRLCLNLHLDNG